MVFAYALLGIAPFRDDAAAVLASSDNVQVPDLLRAELANVIWQWVKHRRVTRDIATAVLHDADGLISQTIAGEHLWERALELAVVADHPAYDTMFVAASEYTNTKVVTFDQRLKAAFPDNVLTATEFL
ncbi:MAG: type II toxin-antitoxin system VapC family toxin [Acidiferrobacterales bacterium]